MAIQISTMYLIEYSNSINWPAYYLIISIYVYFNVNCYRQMRTHAEAIKLAHITQELNRIDSSLSADVSILRDYIEKASLEFSEAE